MNVEDDPAATPADAARLPLLSIVLPTDQWATIAGVIERLKAQNIREHLELIFPTPDPAALEAAAGSGLADFRHARVFETSLDDLSEARALAVPHATAPYVFLGETHTFPHPGWAEAVLRGHETWDVVVPAFDNANPKHVLSWGAFLCDYGWWSEGLEEAELQWWPTTNTSYPRALLESFGEGLAHHLDRGAPLWAEVHRRGMRAGFVAAARIDHANVATPLAWIRERYLAGLLVGGQRGSHWSLPRRIVYAGGGPLLVPLLLKRTYGAVSRAHNRTRLPAGSTTAWLLGTVIKAGGEAIGYLKGVSAADRDLMNEYEIHKMRHTGS